MNRRRFHHLLPAIALGIVAGLPVQLTADDTEIYLGNINVSAGVRPNVLFILDTSGSMSNTDGMSQDRLDRMKDALKTILDDANNINVGLMRFTDPGGPVLFPVSYIDEDVSVITAAGNGADINVQIGASGDDAERNPESRGDLSVARLLDVYPLCPGIQLPGKLTKKIIGGLFSRAENQA